MEVNEEEEQLLRTHVKRFRGGLVFKAHRLLYHSTLGLRVIKMKKDYRPTPLVHLRGRLLHYLSSSSSLTSNLLKSYQLLTTHRSPSMGGVAAGGEPPLSRVAHSLNHCFRGWGRTPLSGWSYRGTSLIRNRRPPGPYSRTVPRALRWSLGGGLFLMREVPL